jgi:hypothetical protein
MTNTSHPAAFNACPWALMLAYQHYASLLATPLDANLGNPALAREYYRRARPMEERSQADPNNNVARYDYATFLLNSAIVEPEPGSFAERGLVRALVETDDRAAALEHVRQLIGEAEAAVTRAADKDLLRASVAEVYLCAAKAYRAFGDWENAQKSG